MYPRLARGHTRLPARPRRVTQNSELLAITYGALVAQLVEDYEDPAAINEQLEKMCEPPEPPELREPRAANHATVCPSPQSSASLTACPA